MTQPEALRLAEELDWQTHWKPHAAELRRLHEEVEELDALRDRLADLLSRTAVALKGPEPPLTRWDWSDLPERALSLHALNQELLEALKDAARCVQDNYLPDKCGHDWDDVIAKAEGQA